MGTVLGESPPRVSKHGHGKTGGLPTVAGRPTMNSLEKKNPIGAARKHFRELTDKAGHRMIPLGRNSRKGMTEP